MTNSSPPDDRPISLNQDHRLLREWILHTRSKEPAPFAGWLGLEFDAEPDRRRLERALTTIVKRHEVVRTAFTEPSSVPASRKSEIFGRLKELPIGRSLFDQRVHADAPVTVSEGALVGLQCDRVARTLRSEVLKSEIERRFRYDSPPLVRATVYKCDGGYYLLSIVLPHLVADAVSMSLLRKELAALYRSPSTPHAALVPLPALQGAASRSR